MASITLNNISKSFRDTQIIKNINLNIEDGECAVLVGPSGCGKSTILRLICGLEEADDGDLYIGERLVNDVPPANRGIAMVFQSYALYPHMTVFENMAFALQVRKFRKDEIEKRVINAAKILKIDHLLERKPKELSGGQRQRVAIGRAIVRNPYAFLFDEPLSNLDSALRHQMRYELARLKAQLKTTMVYVTHDQSEAMTLADKIVVMRDGVIEQVGTPKELFNKPANIFVAKFIGSSEMNMIEVQFEEKNDKNFIFKLRTGEKFSISRDIDYNFDKNKIYSLGLRPDDIKLSLKDKFLDVDVVFIENLGGEGLVYANLPDGTTIHIKYRDIIDIKANDNISLNIDSSKCYMFDPFGRTIFGAKDA